MATRKKGQSEWVSRHASIGQDDSNDVVSQENLGEVRGIPPMTNEGLLGEEPQPIDPSSAVDIAEWCDDFDRQGEQQRGQEARSETQQALNEQGIDAIAYYLPISFYGPHRYGIYIRQRRFFGFCSEVHTRVTNVSWDDTANALLRFVMHHEAFHAAVELSCLTNDDYDERKVARTYHRYFDLAVRKWRHSHSGPHYPYRCPEEQLAQHAGFTALPVTTAGDMIRAELLKVFKKGPADYVYDVEDWRRRVPTERQVILERALHRVQSASLLSRSFPSSVSAVHAGIEARGWFPKDGAKGVLSGKHGIVPTYLVDTGPEPFGRFARAHSPRNIPVRDVLRVLKKRGVQVEEGGKHTKLIFPNHGRPIPFSRSAQTMPEYVMKKFATALSTSLDTLVAECRA